MIEKQKCLIVKPKESIETVKAFLNSQKISYNFDNDDNMIFANIDEIPVSLEEIAEVIDPVLKVGDRWRYQIPNDEPSNLVDSEHDARCGFVAYISWSGEFVKN